MYFNSFIRFGQDGYVKPTYKKNENNIENNVDAKSDATDYSNEQCYQVHQRKTIKSFFFSILLNEIDFHDLTVCSNKILG